MAVDASKNFSTTPDIAPTIFGDFFFLISE